MRPSARPSWLRSVLALAALWLAVPAAQAQVCEGPIRLSSQGQVDAFDCTEVTSDLTVSGPDVVNLDGLASLTSVGGYLDILANSELRDLTGLGGLTSVGRTLAIRGNSALTDLTGLGGLTSVGGNLRVWGNDALADLSGLGGITSVGGTLAIVDNGALTDLGALASLSSLGGYLQIEYNDALMNLAGLDGLTSVGETLSIFGNPVLTDLTGLDGIASVGDDLSIWSNGALTDLTGLGGLNSVGGHLSIGDNGALTHLDALASVSSVGGALRVEHNAVLGACTIGLYDLLTSGEIGGSVEVGDNAPGCNSVEEILNAVDAEDEAAPLVNALAPPYPNPTAGAATLAFTLAEPADVRLTVYDALGRRVATLAEGTQPAGAHEASFGAGLPAGVYVVRLETGGQAWTERVTFLR